MTTTLTMETDSQLPDQDRSNCEPLAERTCAACRGNTPRLTREEQANLLRQLPEWTVLDEHHLSREFPFADFAQALAFANEVGRIAEEQGHHPEVTVGWGYARVIIFTHAVNGLTESDFILAAKLDTP